jgi:hypothetical protein
MNELDTSCEEDKYELLLGIYSRLSMSNTLTVNEMGRNFVVQEFKFMPN